MKIGLKESAVVGFGLNWIRYLIEKSHIFTKVVTFIYLY